MKSEEILKSAKLGKILSDEKDERIRELEEQVTDFIGITRDFYEDIVELVKNNSEGEIFLVGGTVSRTLASALYGGNQKNQDFDFVVEKLKKKFKKSKRFNKLFNELLYFI